MFPGDTFILYKRELWMMTIILVLLIIMFISFIHAMLKVAAKADEEFNMYLDKNKK